MTDLEQIIKQAQDRLRPRQAPRDRTSRWRFVAGLAGLWLVATAAAALLLVLVVR